MSATTLPSPVANTRVRDVVDVAVAEFRAMIDEAWTGSRTANSAIELREQGNPSYAGILPASKVHTVAMNLEIEAGNIDNGLVRAFAAKIRKVATSHEGGNVDPNVIGRFVDSIEQAHLGKL